MSINNAKPCDWDRDLSARRDRYLANIDAERIRAAKAKQTLTRSEEITMSINDATPSDWDQTCAKACVPSKYAETAPSKPTIEPVATAKKFDQDKPDVSLVCPEFILGTADILTFGARKYGKRNYLESKGDQDYYDRLYAALQRHLLAYAAGELLDEESGKPHLFHAAANLAMLTDLGAHNA